MDRNTVLDQDFNSFFDSFNKSTPEIIIQEYIDSILKQLRPLDIVLIDEESIYVPGIVLPGLLKQPSLSTSATTARDITDITDEPQVQSAINAINIELEKFFLYWDITPKTISKKLKDNKNYLRNTLYGIWNLKLGADLAMIKSISKNPDIAGAETLIIDYSNLKIGLRKECSPSKKIDASLAKEIALLMRASECRRIIISIQNNDKDRPEFKEFRAELKRIYGNDNVIVIVGSNASSFDDLNIAYIVTNILPESIKHIITSDKFRDLNRLETDTTTGAIRRIPIFPPLSSDPKMIMIKVSVFCSPPLAATTPGLIESGTTGFVPTRAPMEFEPTRAPMRFEPTRAPTGFEPMRAPSRHDSLREGRSHLSYSPSRRSSSDTRRDGPSRHASLRDDRSSYGHSLEHSSHLSYSPSRRSSSDTSHRVGPSDYRYRYSPSYGHRSSRRSPSRSRSRSPLRRGHRGGTINYKKSLLNKRTRKIYKKNYPRKMKKYSKNKKKEHLKKKTLRRRL